MCLRKLTFLLTALALLALPSWGDEGDSVSVKVRGFGNRERPVASAPSNEEHGNLNGASSENRRPVVDSNSPYPYKSQKSEWGESLIHQNREKITHW